MSDIRVGVERSFGKIITRNKFVSFGRSIQKRFFFLKSSFGMQKKSVKEEFKKPGLRVVFEKKHGSQTL